MMSIDWEQKLQDLDVEKSWSAFKAEYEKCVEMYVPHKNVNTNKHELWFTKKVKEAVRKKYVLVKKYRQSKSYVDKVAYVYQRNITETVVSKAKKDYESKIMRLNQKGFTVM